MSCVQTATFATPTLCRTSRGRAAFASRKERARRWRTSSWLAPPPLLCSLLLGAPSPAYAAATGTWVPTANKLSEGRIDAGAVRLQDGRVLVAGGCGEVPASADVYDPATSTFAATGDM